MNVVTQESRISDRLVAACAGGFIVILAVAAYWDSSIRILHAFEAIPYLAAGVLAIRRVKFGYMLGAASGAFWLWTAGFLTTFIRNGFERLALLLRTGHVDRLDILIAVPAAIAAAGLVFFSGLSYARSARKVRSDAAVLLGTTALVAVFFLAIFFAFAPQYLGMFRAILPGGVKH